VPSPAVDIRPVGRCQHEGHVDATDIDGAHQMLYAMVIGVTPLTCMKSKSIGTIEDIET
jgi:hypothetical protein